MSTEHIIVDGYNVIFRTPRLDALVATSLERARDELLRWLEEAYRARKGRITLVFDGERDPMHIGRTRRGSVRVIFSRPPDSADDVIRRLVDEDRKRGTRQRLACRVVSSDAAVATHARLAGGKAVGVESFLRELGGHGSPERTPPRTGTAGTGEGGASAPPVDRHQREGRRPRSTDGAGEEVKPRVKGKRDLDEWERMFQEGESPAEDDDRD